MKKLLIKLFLCVIASGLSGILYAAPFADRAIRTDYPLTRVSENVYVIHGPNEEVSRKNQAFRNNPVIVLTSKGAVVIDPGSSVYIGEMIVNKVKGLTDKPIVAVFNTHGHGDHWLGNHGINKHYPQVVIYAHENMIRAISAGDGDMWVDAINKRSEGAIEGTRVVAPNTAVKNGEQIQVGGVTFKVYFTGKAHSDNDIMLELPEEKVFVVGDILRVGNISPFMSSFSGNLHAFDVVEQSDAKVYIPGHGKSGDKSIITIYREFVTTLKGTVKKYYDQDMSDYEMKPKVINELAKYKEWSGFDENIGRLINLAYLEVEADSF